MKRYKSINSYLTKALLESHIDNVKSQKSTLCVVLFMYEVDLENAFLFKDIVHKLYKDLSFDEMFYNENDSFLIILKGKRLQEAVTMFDNARKVIMNDFGVSIDRVGITELSLKDTLDDLLKRVQRFYVTSKRLSSDQIIYGSREFDFFGESSKEETFFKIIKKEPDLHIINFYKGFPIREKATLIKLEKKKICLKTSREQMIFLQKDRDFLSIRHKNFPSVVKAKIDSIDVNNFIICITDLQFLDPSVVGIDNIKIKPTKQINCAIYIKKSIIGHGIVQVISVDIISLKVDKNCLKNIILQKDKKFTLGFRLFSKESIAVDQVRLEADFVKVKNDEVVFLSRPNAQIRSKIQDYIKGVQIEMEKNLRRNLLAKN